MLFTTFLMSRIQQGNKKSDDNFTKASHALNKQEVSHLKLNRKDILDQEINLKSMASSATATSDWGFMGPKQTLYFLESSIC